MQQLFDGFDVLDLSDGINTDSAALGWMIWISAGFFCGWHMKILILQSNNYYISIKLCKMSTAILPIIP
jgi:hypothetical protein